jgi:hypothetical protein
MRKAPHFGKKKIDLKRRESFERYFAARYANAPAPVQAWKASFDKWAVTQTRPHALIDIEADINFTELERIGEPVAAGYEELSQAMEEYEAQVAALQQQWQPFFEQWLANQSQVEMEAAQQVASQLVDSVYVDGSPLRDMVGGPEDWMMARRVPGSHNNVRSLFALNKVVMQETVGDIAHVHISLPEEEEINAFL